MDKVVASAAEAVADIPDGAVLGISGFGASHNFPVDLIEACADRDLRDLTLVCNSLGVSDAHPRRLVQAGRVSRLRAAFSARAAVPNSSAQQQSPVPIDVELIPQGILVERLRSAGSGLGPFYSPVGVDTEIAEGKGEFTPDWVQLRGKVLLQPPAFASAGFLGMEAPCGARP